jgi:hypothetical protein
MAKCDLTIRLDNPDQVHTGGEMISGTVHVACETDVKCNALEISTVWRTHGKGNVASGIAESQTLFSGSWKADEQNAYPFELRIADWPPSYHGHYLNIDHYIDVRAKIPWSFDAKASQPFQMRPGSRPESGAAAGKATTIGGFSGCAIGAGGFGFLMVLVVTMAQAGLFAWLFLTIPLLGLGVWFVRSILPKFLLGNVQCAITTESVAPGDVVAGELIVRPRRDVAINGVILNFQSREQCVSGSGSNRTTHSHTVFEQIDTLSPTTTLKAGQENRFPFSVSLPADAPYSIDLDDNDLIWSATLRVDIPRWPDWVRELPLLVLPATTESRQPASSPRPIDPQRPSAAPNSAADLTFAETVAHLSAVGNDRLSREQLVEAVTGLTFDIDATVERRLLYAGANNPQLPKDGYAVWAHYPDPPLPLVLYVPRSAADDFEQLGGQVWRGRGTIVGWDSLHGRLQVELERPG